MGFPRRPDHSHGYLYLSILRVLWSGLLRLATDFLSASSVLKADFESVGSVTFQL